MKYDQLMLDLETFSTRADAVILSVGLAPFSLSDGVGEGVEVVLDLDAQAQRHISHNTVLWWMQQSLEARNVFSAKRIENDLAMCRISDFIAENTVGSRKVLMWGNGSDFDNVLLANWWDWGKTYYKFDLSRPWMFYNNRCFRTLKNMRTSFEEIQKSVPRITHHNALDDARWQAECAVQMLQQIA